MARAYKKTYLNGAMRNLAVMMDCGVRKYGYTIGEFYQKFLSSGVSRQFGQGNPRYLVGMSGAELARKRTSLQNEISQRACEY